MDICTMSYKMNIIFFVEELQKIWLLGLGGEK